MLLDTVLNSKSRLTKQVLYKPAARFHVTEGLGKPSALHSILASLPWAKALSVGSRIQRGGTVAKQDRDKYIDLKPPSIYIESGLQLT